MFTTIDSSFSPWPPFYGLSVIAAALAMTFAFQIFSLQALKLAPPVIGVPVVQVVHLAPPPKPVAAVDRAGKEKPAVAAAPAETEAHGPASSVIPGTPQWRQHVEHGRGLDLEIVAERSLPVLRAYGVALALSIRRPRGEVLIYNLANGRLTRGVVPDDAVVREVEGLPAEFDAPLREAERELGARPRVWALYPSDLFSALRSLTEDALRKESVSIDSVKTARVRLNLVGGQAFVVKLVSH